MRQVNLELLGAGFHERPDRSLALARRRSRSSGERPGDNLGDLFGFGPWQPFCRHMPARLTVRINVGDAGEGIVTLTGASHSLTNSAPKSGRHASALPNLERCGSKLFVYGWF
jgi:hypothetical protein